METTIGRFRQRNCKRSAWQTIQDRAALSPTATRYDAPTGKASVKLGMPNLPDEPGLNSGHVMKLPNWLRGRYLSNMAFRTNLARFGNVENGSLVIITRIASSRYVEETNYRRALRASYATETAD